VVPTSAVDAPITVSCPRARSWFGARPEVGPPNEWRSYVCRPLRRAMWPLLHVVSPSEARAVPGTVTGTYRDRCRSAGAVPVPLRTGPHWSRCVLCAHSDGPISCPPQPLIKCPPNGVSPPGSRPPRWPGVGTVVQAVACTSSSMG
jgi:hypothetical protein